jgi:hypothetical protein
MQTLSLSRYPRAPKPRPAPLSYYVIDEPVEQAALEPVPQRRVAVVTTHDRAVMRDLVLGAFLGPQHFREDDGRRVGAYTTENTRDAFPSHLEALRECPTDSGESGRLPPAYVAALAKGTTRVIASETRPKKKSSTPLGPLAFQDARIVRAVGQLAPEHQHWIRYAYADSKAWDDEAGAVVALWARYEPQLGKVQAKTKQKAKGLAHLAVQDAKRFVNAGKELHAAGRLRELLGVSTPNWDQHWCPRWQGMRNEVFAMDRDALTALCKQLAGFRFVLMDRGL